MRFPHDVVGFTAVCPVICFVQVIDEQVGPGQHGVLGHFIIDSHPGYLDRPVEKRGDRSVISTLNHTQGDTTEEDLLQEV